MTRVIVIYRYYEGIVLYPEKLEKWIVVLL